MTFFRQQTIPKMISAQPKYVAEAPKWRSFATCAGFLLLAFGLPLYEVTHFAMGSELYSHIPLIPFASAYLAWIDRAKIPRQFRPNRGAALLFGLLGLGAIAAFWGIRGAGIQLQTEDSLSLSLTGFLLLLASASCVFLGRDVVRALAFPLGFLVFIVPFPTPVHAAIESFLQHGSASVAFGFFKISGMPVFMQDLFFRLPGFSMQVAPECSGIHSSLALLITSLVAGRLFLRSPWRRTALALFVIPLALIRNGFRVFVIGQLCVRISPDMIHSYIHRQGGPIFFALSLIPFSLVLWFLFRSERALRQPHLKSA